MKKIMIVFGTRPEAIKMCPLIKELQKDESLKTVVCVSGQHRDMVNSVLKNFYVTPDYNLNIMKEAQTLFDITISILEKIRYVLNREKPDLVVVHGDTSTTFGAALASFYMKIPVAHVEAGLRTYNKFSPYPEEFNRHAVSVIAEYHFAPTEDARKNLLKEGISPKNIYVTGNTVIDSFKYTVSENYCHELMNWLGDSRFIMATAHRRENVGERMRGMFRAIRRTVDINHDIKVIYPIHMNPCIRTLAEEEFANCKEIKLVDPLDVTDFHNFLSRCYAVVTDSGGIQEEASYLGKPVLVMRDETERREGVESGNIMLVGTEEERIFKSLCGLLNDNSLYEKMSVSSTVYGDGRASERIAEILRR